MGVFLVYDLRASCQEVDPPQLGLGTFDIRGALSQFS
jgi:hypothetical protein